MTTETTQHSGAALDEAKAQAFAERMLSNLNGAALMLMTSIGHRVRLFDTLAGMRPSTSDQIALAASLNERYVREWLGAMVTGRVMEYDPSNQTYWLPAEHAAVLTRAAIPNNVASTAQFIPILGSVEDEIVRSFVSGGGVPYSSYPRFHEAMAEESDVTTVFGLLDSILPLVPNAIDDLRKGISVLDVGCGRGRALMLLAEKFPQSNFTGYDFSTEAITNATREANERSLSNVRFEVKDVADTKESERYELITAFDAIHDQAAPRNVLKGIARALKPGGTFLMQDVRASSHVDKNMDHPLGPFIYTISCLHCMTVSLALGGEGLGAAWGEEKALELLAEAGFNNVDVRQLPHDTINNYYIATRT